MLRATADVGLDPGFAEFAAEHVLDVLNEGFALDALLVECACDLGVLIGLQVAERKVFEFPFELPDAKAVCQCCVDFTRLDREVVPVGLVSALGVPQAVELLGDPDEHEADVGHDGQEHFAQSFRLLDGQRLARAPVGGHLETAKLLQTKN